MNLGVLDVPPQTSNWKYQVTGVSLGPFLSHFQNVECSTSEVTWQKIAIQSIKEKHSLGELRHDKWKHIEHGSTSFLWHETSFQEKAGARPPKYFRRGQIETCDSTISFLAYCSSSNTPNNNLLSASSTYIAIYPPSSQECDPSHLQEHFQELAFQISQPSLHPCYPGWNGDCDKGLSHEMKLRNESLAVGSASLAFGMAVIMMRIGQVCQGCWSGIDWTSSLGVLVWSYSQIGCKSRVLGPFFTDFLPSNSSIHWWVWRIYH